MSRILCLVMSLLFLATPVVTQATPKEEGAAAMQAWIDAMTSHDAERVMSSMILTPHCGAPGLLRCATIRRRFATTSKSWPPFHRHTKRFLVSSEFASMAIWRSTPGHTPFPRWTMARRSFAQRGSVLCTGIAAAAG